MRQFMAGFEALDGGLGGLHARHLLVADGLRQAPRRQVSQVGHDFASWTSTRRKSSTSAANGSSLAMRSAVWASSAAGALAAARRAGGISRYQAGSWLGGLASDWGLGMWVFRSIGAWRGC